MATSSTDRLPDRDYRYPGADYHSISTTSAHARLSPVARLIEVGGPGAFYGRRGRGGEWRRRGRPTLTPSIRVSGRWVSRVPRTRALQRRLSMGYGVAGL